MARTYLYSTTFGGTDPLQGASSTTVGTGVGVGNAPGTSANNTEYNLFSLTGSSLNPTNATSYEGSLLKLNSGLVGEERVSNFNVSMILDLSEGGDSNTGAPGNKQPDGVSFNFGDLGTFPSNTVNSARLDYEKGVSEGLSIRINPVNLTSLTGRGSMSITWNGQQLDVEGFSGSGFASSSAVSAGPGTFSITITDAGVVSASFAGVTVSATIPSGAWSTVDQSGWDFGVAGRTGSAAGSAYIDNLSVSANVLLCFCKGTVIATERGPVRVEDLSIHDRVQTLKSGYQPIRWIGRRHISAEELRRKPKFRAVRISAGALGDGCPSKDLLVSPQHRVLVRSKIAQRMFGTMEVLIPAKDLCGLDGVAVDTERTEVEYYHILLDQHDLVASDGAWTESLYAGAEAMKFVPRETIEEIRQLFPDQRPSLGFNEPRVPFARGHQARNLASRHQKNGHPVQ